MNNVYNDGVVPRVKEMMINFIRKHALLLLVSLTLNVGVNAATITIVNKDGAGEGLNDTTIISAVSGNFATTLGRQYLNVFQAAADYWAQRINSNVVISVEGQMNPLSCGSNSAKLGYAGALNGHVNFLGAPESNTIYPAALANSLAGIDLDASENDITAVFNDALNGSSNCLNGIKWWLGINSPAPEASISLFDTILHEIGHGLGFASYVDENGAKPYSASMNAYLDDAFMFNLLDKTTNKLWPNMNDVERAASAVNTGQLVWNGSNVTANSGFLTAGKNGSNVTLHAPYPYENGSSVSHWATQLQPNELMEPYATLTSSDCITMLAMKDIAWHVNLPQSKIKLSQAQYAGSELNGSLSVSIQISPAPCGVVSVNLNTADGTAYSGTDYTAVSQTLTWPTGDSSAKVVVIPLLNDSIEDSEEQFTISLTNLIGGFASIVSPSIATITIWDEEVPVDDELCVPIKSKNNKIVVICL